MACSPRARSRLFLLTLWGTVLSALTAIAFRRKRDVVARSAA
jgi:hypothetical protein